ncbi:Sialin [Portunus trituberculatus]|uniref:Sialin n=1 Tax=Portunus trituberculatus TaxID=210409 RepID=A0A5B7DG73_PORTR|nr:Sialin [Portunus trituberculatus]
MLQDKFALHKDLAKLVRRVAEYRMGVLAERWNFPMTMKDEEQPPIQAAVRVRQSSLSVAVVGSDEAVVGASSGALSDTHYDRPRAWWGCRHTLAFLGFLGFSTVYAMRVNLSVAIVAMVKSTSGGEDGKPSYTNDSCPAPPGLILGSFFYGYLFTNFPGGRASEYFGGKRVLGIGILLTAIFTIVSPVCARVSTGLFVAVRVIEGLCEGVTFPAMNNLLATWIPPMERAKFSSLVFAGIYGPMVGLVAMCFVDCDKTLAIVVLCIAVGLNGAIYSGYMCSHQDLSPNLAGTLMGITNTAAAIPGFVTPVVTGALTEQQTLSSWRGVFLISAGVYLVTNIGYLLFVPVTVQPWNDLSSSPESKEGTPHSLLGIRGVCVGEKDLTWVARRGRGGAAGRALS